MDAERLLTLADAVVRETGHTMACGFAGCTCGAVERFKVARTDYLRLRQPWHAQPNTGGKA